MSPSLPRPSCLQSPPLRVGGHWVAPASNLGLCRCSSSPLASPHIPPNQCLSPAELCPQPGGNCQRGGGLAATSSPRFLPAASSARRAPPPCWATTVPRATTARPPPPSPLSSPAPGAPTSHRGGAPSPQTAPPVSQVRGQGRTPTMHAPGQALPGRPARVGLRPGSGGELLGHSRPKARLLAGGGGSLFLHAPQSLGTPCPVSPIGFYCLLPGLVAVSGPCSAGFHCTRGASVPSPTDGVTGDLCPPGHFCPQGSPRPAPCPAGESRTVSASPEVCFALLREGRSRGPALGTLPGSDIEDPQLHLAASVHPAPT